MEKFAYVWGKYAIFPEIKEENSSCLPYSESDSAVQLKIFQVFNFLKVLLTFDILMYLYLLTTETFCLLLVVFPFCCRGFQEQQYKEIAFPIHETKCQAGHNWMGKGFIEPRVGYIAFQVQTLTDSLYNIQ